MRQAAGESQGPGETEEKEEGREAGMEARWACDQGSGHGGPPEDPSRCVLKNDGVHCPGGQGGRTVGAGLGSGLSGGRNALEGIPRQVCVCDSNYQRAAPAETDTRLQTVLGHRWRGQWR